MRNRMIKILALLLCTAMLLSLGACNEAPDPSSSTGSISTTTNSASATNPPGTTAGGEEVIDPVQLRVDRDLESYISPGNVIDEESLPSAEGRVEQTKDGYVLKGESFRLVLESGTEGYGVKVVDLAGNVCSVQQMPVVLYIRGAGEHASGYSAVTVEAYGLKGSKTVITEKGSELLVEDRYYLAQKAEDSFNVRRAVKVITANSGDKGFESVYRMEVPTGAVEDYSWFVPNNVFDEFPTRGYSYADSVIYRETLLGLPYAMFRSKASGLTFSLGRYQPEVTNVNNSYASVSLVNDGGSAHIEIAYPSRDAARKYFSLKQDAQIVYDLTLHAENTDSYSEASVNVYNVHFTLQDQRIVATDIDQVYNAVCEDFKTFMLSNTASGVISYGLPWRVTIENGKIGPKSYQAGFVGQQIPAAYHMLYYGIMNDDAKSFTNGMNVLDFWIDTGMMTGAGIPKIWYDGNYNYFWKYPTFTRMAVDAMEGLLDAYRLVTAHGVDRQSWYDAITAYADFLVREQNSDGSWFRCYNWDGKMFVNGDNGISEPGGNICQSSSKANSTMPVRFLGKMYELTGNEDYKAAAVRGGEYVYQELYPKGYYNGGTCDNPNAKDKEAGVYAMYCYDTMYMLTGDSKWIDCLKQATAFTMSTVIAYSFDVSENSSDLKAAYALKHGYTDGLSFITCNGTGVDNYIAYIYYELFRIYIITGEDVYLKQAEFIQQNTKSTMDWDGALDYPYKSLVAEASTIYSFGFRSAVDDDGVEGVWLPWASVANAEPIAKMYENFGQADVMEVVKGTSLERLREILEHIGVGGHEHTKYLTTAVSKYL